jgi:hypothetical protein
MLLLKLVEFTLFPSIPERNRIKQAILCGIILEKNQAFINKILVEYYA